MNVSEKVDDKPIQIRLSENQKLELLKLTDDCVARARRHFSDCEIDSVRVEFNLRGAAAGQYHPQDRLIRYNASIAARNFEKFKQRTVPHEVSHHIALSWAKHHGIRIKPHGKEWQAVMQLMGVADSQRCHNYDITGVNMKRQRRVNYRCACDLHEVSMTIHNRIGKGMIYKCRSCDAPLKQVSRQSP